MSKSHLLRYPTAVLGLVSVALLSYFTTQYQDVWGPVAATVVLVILSFGVLGEFFVPLWRKHKWFVTTFFVGLAAFYAGTWTFWKALFFQHQPYFPATTVVVLLVVLTLGSCLLVPFLNRHVSLATVTTTTVLFLTLVFFNLFGALLLTQSWKKLLYVLAAVFVFDTFSFFGGLTLRHLWPTRLAPETSPNKTWVGFVTGFTCAALFLGLYGFYVLNFTWILFAMCTLLPLVCQGGDLFFSAVKRSQNRKNFSALLPGHGGLTDRLDSLMFVVITFGALTLLTVN